MTSHQTNYLTEALLLIKETTLGRGADCGLKAYEVVRFAIVSSVRGRHVCARSRLPALSMLLSHIALYAALSIVTDVHYRPLSSDVSSLARCPSQTVTVPFR